MNVPCERIAGLTIVPARFERTVAVYTGICGTAPTIDGTTGARTARIHLSAARVDLVEGEVDGGPSAPGLRRLVLGAPGRRAVDQPMVVNGVPVELSADAFSPGADAAPCRLDHVAIAVRDLGASSDRWERLLGVAPAHRGQHPLGGFDAARFLLGAQMIELVSPTAGNDSSVKRRLDTAGEGVITVALIPVDLEGTIAALARLEAAMIRQAPHVFVHPRDAGGVLVQLTPRL